MRIRLLGAVRVEGGDGAVDLGPRRQRFVLGLLALEVNQVLPVERMVELAWPAAPPPTATHAIRVCVSRLRRAIAASGGDQAGIALATSGSGYLLRADPGRVDVHDFHIRVRRAAALADDAARVAALDDALGLWSGPPLDGVVPAEVRARLCGGLEESRLGALEDRIDARLRLGHEQLVLAELTALVADHPFRERLIGQLMLALHRSGRTADALAVFRDTRDRLAEELGIDPGADLQRLELAILRGEVEQAQPREAGSATSPAPARPPLTPAQLPSAVAAFVGRDADLDQLHTLMTGDLAARTVALAMIVGTAGVGKTALAVRWAHQVADRFPDGQLYINLRGFDTDLPVTPLAALARVLSDLGVPIDQVPADLEQATSLFRSLLSGRRVLLLLDNAATAEQARPLLPGSPGSAVVVTTRTWLTGLMAFDGASAIPLEPLPHIEAVTLLTRLLGTPRVDGERAALHDLGRLCAGLPLALRIAAAHLGSHPRLTITQYVLDLGQGDRLALLSTDDRPAAVRATFDLSYRRLPEPDQRAFRMLGLVPGPDTTPAAAAALLGTGESAAAALDRLVAACLLQQHQPGRYQPHDLLRTYAAELAAGRQCRTDSAAGQRRLYDWYLRRATGAARTLYPHTVRLPDSAPLPGTRAGDHPQAGDHQQELSWLDAERGNLLAAVTLPASADLWEAQVRLADALRGYFNLRRDLTDWLVVAEAAYDRAQRLGDATLLTAAHINLANVYAYLEDPRAADHHRSAATLARQAGWWQAEATALSNLAMFHVHNGQLVDGVRQLVRALSAQERVGSQSGQAIVLSNLGLAYHWLGEPGRAIEHHTRALRIYQDLREDAARASVEVNLAYACVAAGELTGALAHASAALPVLRQVGAIAGEALALDNLALVHRDRGEIDLALTYAQQAIRLATTAGDRIHATALITIASCRMLRDAPEAALTDYTLARELARAASARYVEAEADLGLARVSVMLRRYEEARRHAAAAHDLARACGFRALAEAAGGLARAIPSG